MNHAVKILSGESNSVLRKVPQSFITENAMDMLALLKSALTGKAGIYSVNDYRGITYVRSVAENITGTFCLPGGIYNFGSGNDKNMYDTACIFLVAMGMVDRIPDLIQLIDTLPPRNLMMDCTKIRKYGIDFESTTEGIKKMVADYQGLFQ